jgi:hypothetical protein
MLERRVGLTSKEPEQSAPVPPASAARVEGKTAVDQPKRDIDILAEIFEDKGCEREDVRVVSAATKCPSSKIYTGVPGGFRVFGQPLTSSPW